MLDVLGRPLRDVRISVTDRCNFRCVYCMPADEYRWIERAEVLSFEEIGRLAGIFRSLGAENIRLTGGEPLVRRNLAELVKLLLDPKRARTIPSTGFPQDFHSPPGYTAESSAVSKCLQQQGVMQCASYATLSFPQLG